MLEIAPISNSMLISSSDGSAKRGFPWPGGAVPAGTVMGTPLLGLLDGALAPESLDGVVSPLELIGATGATLVFPAGGDA